MTSYTKAGDEEKEVLETTINNYHPQIKSADVSFCILFVFADTDKDGMPKGPALKLHGVPALATMKIISLKLRAHGLSDAEILIDGDRWGGLTDRQRVALLDHELNHIEPNYKDNMLVLDDLNRPKLSIRQHDYNFGWFIDVVQRHGESSVESMQANAFMEESGQLFLGFDIHADSLKIIK